MKFTPSLWLFLPRVIGGLIAFGALGYLWQGFFDHIWWSLDYLLTLAIPTLLLPCILWVWLVPREMDVSDGSLHISLAFRGDRKVDWSELESWGKEEVIRLQFANGPTFEIALFAFPRDQRKHLIDFLERRYLDRKAHGWFSNWGKR